MMTLTKEDLQAIEGLFSKRFDKIDQRLDAVERRLDTVERRLDAVDQRLDAMDQRLDSLENTVKHINLRLNHVERDIALLKKGQKELSNKLSVLSDKVDATLEIVMENWNQIEKSKARLALLES